MIMEAIWFLIGVYFGQEHDDFPNVKDNLEKALVYMKKINLQQN